MQLLDLIERYNRNAEAYRSTQYNETQLRREFLDPFFDALGWDVENKNGYAEAYKDVVHEDAIKIGGVTKAPDYSFRIGGTRKFFVEAKKPSIRIKDDPDPAFQLRRYAWSAKLPLSILTNFEEFAVYDCRIKPDKTDKASTGRILYFTYAEYEKRWEEIAAVFSREAVLKGSFDKYAESTKTKKGTAEVDAAFLKEIESWREILARTLALRNPALSQRNLNFTVQTTIDRIIFLRICEDRGIEDYGRLQSLQNGTNVYERLCQLFRQADERYNSGLFHFREEKTRPEPPDDLTLSLLIDDKVIKEIIKNLYYPDSPYEFSVLSADILGQVYEQFLGKVIHLTTGHRAVIEDKPEVKKAGGVYYTPRYIVDYIVKNTVGKLLEGKTPKQAAAIKVLDPACGSGSFLIGAYQYLLDWHRDWYAGHTPERLARGKSPALYQAPGGEWRLTTGERKRILLNSIFGVDIDTQAVEVTKLSLLLKVLEGETEQSISRQMALFHERALPDLSDNIKCGNSLIGPDFYDGGQGGLFDDTERYRINVFDWGKEFSEIMTAGGFDAVIGNPPYIQSRSEQLPEADKAYYMSHYFTAENQLNTYGLFIERSLKTLKNKGLFGMIIPNYWLSTRYDKRLRQYLFKSNSVIEILNVYNVFANATVDTVILIAERTEQVSYPKKFIVKDINPHLKTIPQRLEAVKNCEYSKQIVHTIEELSDDVSVGFAMEYKLRGNKTLGDYFTFKFGMKPYQKGKGKPPQTKLMIQNKIYDSEVKTNEDYFKLLRARNVHRYCLTWQEDWIKYGKGLAEPRTFDLFNGERILINRIVSGECLDGTYTSETFICNTDIITFRLRCENNSQFNILYFLGILLSRPVAFYLKSRNVNLNRAAFPKINTETLGSLPVPSINISLQKDVAIHDLTVSLVEQMLSLHKQLAEARTPHDKTAIQRQIDATDRQIDRLVYELYGLTEEEIKIVES